MRQAASLVGALAEHDAARLAPACRCSAGSGGGTEGSRAGAERELRQTRARSRRVPGALPWRWRSRSDSRATAFWLALALAGAQLVAQSRCGSRGRGTCSAAVAGFRLRSAAARRSSSGDSSARRACSAAALVGAWLVIVAGAAVSERAGDLARHASLEIGAAPSLLLAGGVELRAPAGLGHGRSRSRPPAACCTRVRGAARHARRAHGLPQHPANAGLDRARARRPASGRRRARGVSGGARGEHGAAQVGARPRRCAAARRPAVHSSRSGRSRPRSACCWRWSASRGAGAPLGAVARVRSASPWRCVFGGVSWGYAPPDPSCSQARSATGSSARRALARAASAAWCSAWRSRGRWHPEASPGNRGTVALAVGLGAGLLTAPAREGPPRRRWALRSASSDSSWPGASTADLGGSVAEIQLLIHATSSWLARARCMRCS